MAFLDRSGDAFRRALDEIRRDGRASPDDGVPSVAAPGSGVGCDLGPERGGGGEARWGLAMDWADETPAPRAPTAPARQADPAPAPADVAEAVARELGFAAGMTAQALTERWRAFVWSNHPDRQPADARDRANARVAVANALYDRARRGAFRA